MGPDTRPPGCLPHRPLRAHRPCSALRSLGSRVLPGSPSLLPGSLSSSVHHVPHTGVSPRPSMRHRTIYCPGGGPASLPVHAVHSLRKCVLTQSQYLSLKQSGIRHSTANPSYNELPRGRRVHVTHLNFPAAPPHPQPPGATPACPQQADPYTGTHARALHGSPLTPNLVHTPLTLAIQVTVVT